MSGNNNSSGDAEFDAFEKAGTVEIGESDASKPEGEQEEKPARRPSRPPREPKSAEAAKDAAKDDKAAEGEGDDDDDTGTDEGEDGEDDEGEEEQQPKPRKTAAERIQEINRGRREDQRRHDREMGAMRAEIDALKNGGLPNNRAAGNDGIQDTPAPDPSDATKYPLGHLDDRYIEDKIEWVANQKATAQSDAVLQRQQENERNSAAQAQQTELLGKVDEITDRGADLHDDYQELVVDAGMRGDWDLTQTTFEACHEAVNGAQILLDLAQDKKEATRVAKLSPLGQLKFVQEKDAEITAKGTPRRKPQAGAPAANAARGANSRVQGNPATNDLNDFEKQWKRDEAGSKN